jgi:signal transduction histidine kinase
MLVFGFFIMYTEFNHHHNILSKNVDKEMEKVTNLFRVREESIKQMYTMRLKNLTEHESFKNAIIRQDLEFVRKALAQKYFFFKREDPSIQVLHLIDKNNISIFRAHNPDFYGDDLENIRPLVKMVNKTQKMYAGYEEGIYNISYRVLLPIIYNNKHYGLIEIGLALDSILKKARNIFEHDLYMVLINNKNLDRYKFKSLYKRYDEDYLVYSMDSRLKDIKLDFKNGDFVSLNGKTYKVIISNNYKFSENGQKDMLKMIYFFDVTYFVENFEEIKNQFILRHIVLILAAIIVLYFSFTFYEKRVNILRDENLNKDKMLLQQSKLAIMGEMIAMIAHQWKQPLAAQKAIIGGIQLKKRLNKLQNEDVEVGMDKLNSIINHMNDTISDFTNFFKPNKQKKIIRIEDVLNDCLSIIESSLQRHQIYIHKEYEEIELEIFDKELKQVFLNILSNAKDALVENKETNRAIFIKAFKEDNKNIITISDNAGGIPNDIINKVFDPYFSTKAKNGTGLGLYMSKTIVDEHLNGLLSVSNGIDGAIFRVEV